MISKDVFVSVLDGLRNQYERDFNYMSRVSGVFGCSVGLYDNSVLIRGTILMLQQWFPKDGDFCEIEHWCFERQYGKTWDSNGEVERELAEDFYERLILNNDNL